MFGFLGKLVLRTMMKYTPAGTVFHDGYSRCFILCLSQATDPTKPRRRGNLVALDGNSQEGVLIYYLNFRLGSLLSLLDTLLHLLFMSPRDFL